MEGSDVDCIVYNIIQYLIKPSDQSPSQPRPIRSTLSMNEEGLAPWVYFHYGRRPTYYARRATATEMSGWHTTRVSINFTRGTQTQFSKAVFYKKVVYTYDVYFAVFFFSLLSTINDDYTSHHSNDYSWSLWQSKKKIKIKKKSKMPNQTSLTRHGVAAATSTIKGKVDYRHAVAATVTAMLARECR